MKRVEHHLRMTEKGFLGHTQRALLNKTKMKHVMLGKQWMIDLLEMRIVRSGNKIRFEIVKWHNIMSISSTTGRYQISRGRDYSPY